MDRFKTSGPVVERAAAIVRGGGLVAYPTETYYGLGVDPFNGKAMERLFTVKNRPRVKPVLVLVADRLQVNLLAAHVSDTANRLMDFFWPGPLTLVLPARSRLSPLLTGGTKTIGVRLSSHPLANDLVRAFGGPLTATSANLSGGPAAVTADEVAAVFGDRVDMIVDGGQTQGQGGSTLVRVGNGEIACLREGLVPFERVLACLSGTDSRAVRRER